LLTSHKQWPIHKLSLWLLQCTHTPGTAQSWGLRRGEGGCYYQDWESHACPLHPMHPRVPAHGLAGQSEGSPWHDKQG
jgi:hypothetical protein